MTQLFAGETKAQRKNNIYIDIYISKESLKYFEYLLKTAKYNPELIKPIIRYYSNDIKESVKEMVELG